MIRTVVEGGNELNVADACARWGAVCPWKTLSETYRGEVRPHHSDGEKHDVEFAARSHFV